MTIQKFRFIGEHSSLGYRKGEVYDLVITEKWELFRKFLVIQRTDGSGLCPYSSMDAFFKNWEVPVVADPQTRAQTIEEVKKIIAGAILIEQMRSGAAGKGDGSDKSDPKRIIDNVVRQIERLK